MSTVPSTIRPHLQSLKCPKELADLPAWVMWRYEHEAGEEKPRKIPYWASGEKRTGRHGAPKDRANLVTFAAAKAAAARRGMEGVGFCPLEDWGICALDFDACVLHGELLAAVESLCAGTYGEFSPSGTGARSFFKGNLGNKKSHQRKGWPFGFETFSTRGFVTYTGNVLEITELCETQDTVAELTPEVRALFEERFGDRPIELSTENVSTRPPIGLSERQLHECLEVLDAGMDYDDWIRVGMALHHETNGHGFDFWNEWSAGWPHYPGDDALKSHWNSFGRAGGRVVTANWLVNQANEQGAHIDVTGLLVADFEAIADAPAADDDGLPVIDAPEGKKQRFAPQPWHAFAHGPQPEWIVKHVIPRAELVVLYGPPSAGKSFVALDLAMCIARGVPWRDKRVKQGRVVYIAAEGAGGFRKRLQAYALHHELDPSQPLPFLVIHAAPNLMDKKDALDVARAIVAAGGADLIVVDTLAQVTPGANENAGEDMGVVLAHCKGISIACKGAPVVLIHHAGKDAAKGARGHSSILAAADTMIKVERQVAGRLISVEKQKDGEDGISWAFDLEVVPIGADDDLEPITSCVVRELQSLPTQQAAKARRKLGKWERLAIDALTAVLESTGAAGAEFDLVIDKALELEPAPAGKASVARGCVKRALEGLCSDDTMSYRLEDGVVYVD